MSTNENNCNIESESFIDRESKRREIKDQVKSKEDEFIQNKITFTIKDIQKNILKDYSNAVSSIFIGKTLKEDLKMSYK